jgi:hypothetical protein
MNARRPAGSLRALLAAMTPQERNDRLAEFTPDEWREYLLDVWTAPNAREVPGMSDSAG